MYLIELTEIRETKRNGMDIIGAIKFRVEKVSSDSRQKNILSLLYIVWFLIMTIVFINISSNIVINTIGRAVSLLINSFVKSIKNNLTPTFETSYFIFFDITDVIAFIKLIIPMFVTFIYVKYFEKMKFRTESIYIIINTIITMFLFLDIKIIISLILVIFLLILIVPISSGKYFSVLKNIRYLIYLYEEQNVKVNKKIIQKALIKCFLTIVVCSLLSYLITPFVPIYLGFFLCITFAIRMYMGTNSEDKVLDITRKILYIIVILIYIFLNKQLTAEIDKLLGLIITIYFAWDRLFSISKDIDNLINDKSALFYYEEENISEKKLSKRYVNFNFINTSMDEIELVIQILIRFNIIFYKSIISENDKQVRKEITRLCELYKSLNYKSYYLLIGYIGILINKEQVNKKEYYLELEGLFKESNITVSQKIFPLEAIFEYMSKLCDEEKYEEVISLYKKYLETYVKALDRYILFLLIKAADVVDKSLSEELKKYAKI